MYKRQARNKYGSSLALLSSAISSSTDIVEEKPKVSPITLQKQRVYDLSQSKEAWLAEIIKLSELDQDSYQECVSDFCAQYVDSQVDSLRCVCEWIATCHSLDFLSRCKCFGTLQNQKLTLQVLKQYEADAKDDINFTVFSDCLSKLYQEPWIGSQDIESLTKFVFTAKFVSWATKYNLWRSLVACTNKKIESPCKLTCGKALLVNNTLSSYTVLTMQLLTFDALTLQSILKRCKAIQDVRVKADVYDHLLNYTITAKEANKCLKELGEGMKTLDSSQNVHMVAADIDTWLQTLVSIQPKCTFEDVAKECMERWEENEIRNSLQRIQLDATIYGKSYMKLEGVFRKVYTIIQGSEHKESLLQRLKEEMIEMSDTCSTGHLLRLMNVFSGFSSTSYISVDPTVELKSVLTKRIEHFLGVLHEVYDDDYIVVEQRQTMLLKPLEERICKVNPAACEEQVSVGEKVLNAWMEGDESTLQKYVYSQLPEIKQELRSSYVEQGLMTEETFEEAYRNILMEYFTPSK
jgi:hypothetical protein